MNGTYLNIDCMELMANLKDKEIDLAIVDPPYGINAVTKVYKNRGGYKNKNEKYSVPKTNHILKKWDENIPSGQYFSELFRVSKNQIIWGGNYLIEYLYPTSGWIFWDKDNYSDFSDGELAWTSFDKALKKVFYIWNGMRQGKEVGINSCKGGNWTSGNKDNLEKRIHPTQKPVKLYEWLLTNYAKPNDLILDTHCGSASSLIACENLGFKYIASELDKDYYSQSLQRLEAHLAQGKLFQRVGRDEIRLEQPSMFA